MKRSRREKELLISNIFSKFTLQRNATIPVEALKDSNMSFRAFFCGQKLTDMKIIEDREGWSKSDKRGGLIPVGVLIHGMGQFIGGKYATEFLKGAGLQAHAFIDPNGTIVKAVPSNQIAWHAGLSRHNGLTRLNKHYLGVELLVEGDLNLKQLVEKMDGEDPYTDAQYEALTYLLTEWMEKHPTIERERIAGHSHVSGIDVRDDPKQDPGDGFDWPRLMITI